MFSPANACSDYQMYWTFVGGAAAAIALLWPILALMVLGWGKSERYMEPKQKFIQRKMELALAEMVQDVNKNKSK